MKSCGNYLPQLAPMTVGLLGYQNRSPKPPNISSSIYRLLNNDRMEKVNTAFFMVLFFLVYIGSFSSGNAYRRKLCFYIFYIYLRQ